MKFEDRHGSTHVVERTAKGKKEVYNLDALTERGHASVYVNGQKIGSVVLYV